MVKLYKYKRFSDHLESIFASQKIWFPTRVTLNDPEDLQLELINDVGADVYRQHLLNQAKRESWPSKERKYNLRKAFSPRGNLTPGAMQKIASSQIMLQNYLDGLGILSLSEKEDSHVLWERYGDEERGICITFNMELSEHLLKVEYATPRPQLKLSHLLLSPDAEEEILKVLKTKSMKWSDESEWRYFIRNGNTEFSFLGAVESVKLGKKMPGADREKIVEWVVKCGRQILIEE